MENRQEVVCVPSELGVRTGRLRSGVEAPPLPLAYSVGDGCWLAYCRCRLSWVFKRDEDFVAVKLEKMFFESFRGFGEAGDSGMFWKGAFGEAKSGMLGDRGLVGLKGPLLFSLPDGLDRMASDKVADLGILRTCLRGRCGSGSGCGCGCWCCYCPLSVTRADNVRGCRRRRARGVGERRGTSVGGRSSEMTLGGRRARVRSRGRRVAGGWGRESLSECECDASTWVAAVAAGKRWRAVALSTRLCLLPIVSAQRARDMAVEAASSWQLARSSTQQAARSRIKGRARARAVVRTSKALVEW